MWSRSRRRRCRWPRGTRRRASGAGPRRASRSGGWCASTGVLAAPGRAPGHSRGSGRANPPTHCGCAGADARRRIGGEIAACGGPPRPAARGVEAAAPGLAMVATGPVRGESGRSCSAGASRSSSRFDGPAGVGARRRRSASVASPRVGCPRLRPSPSATRSTEASNQVAEAASVRMWTSLMPWSVDWPTQTPCDSSASRAACSAASGSASIRAAWAICSSWPTTWQCAHRETRRSACAAAC